MLAEHEVVSHRISAELDGLRIVHLSDIHVRAGVRPRRLHRAVELINALRPDLVVLTGDYVCHSPRPLPWLTEALAELDAPKYATLGNHDHWTCARSVRSALDRAGVDVLTNEHRRLHTAQGALLHLVGVDDSITRNDDAEAAFRGVPENATTVVLSHAPQSADFLHRFAPALILSGHTHGGQFFFRRLTPYLWRRMGMPYIAGFYEVSGAQLYVSRGFGGSVPVRFRAPAEVALLTLRSTGAACPGTAAA
ncbi:MAG: metallophosphoesterase [Myxococcaceae bacterium]|nr:metallophosphoesterase [Myxococcaceae bacterium]MCI0672864.1 metallophosphoesterase [Myxococcaceae bacterium]